jgi:hypothetical protein
MADYDLPTGAGALIPYSSLPTTPGLPAAFAGLAGGTGNLGAIYNTLPVPEVSNPFQDIARMLVGFAAGTRGQANPIIEQEMKQREQLLGRQIALSNLVLTERSRKLQEERERRLDIQHGEDQAQKLLDLKSRFAKDTWEMGVQTNNPDMIFAALKSRRDLGLFPADMSDEQLKTTANDRVQAEVLEKRGKSFAISALMGQDMPGMPPDFKQKASTPDGRAMMMSLYGITDPKKALLEQQKEEEQLQQVRFQGKLKSRLAELEITPVLTPGQRLERDGLQRVLHGPTKDSDEMTLTRALMEKNGLPLEVAMPRAAKMMAEAKKQPKEPSDFDEVVSAIQAATPGLSRGEAVLQAWSQQTVAKKGFEDIKTNLDAAEQIVNQIADYSSRVHQAQGLPGRAYQGVTGTIGNVLGMSDDIAGLTRQRAYLASVMRSLGGERGVITDKDMIRGEALINASPFTSKSIADATIAELREIVARARKKLAERQKQATTIGSAPKANDPLGLRD